MWQKMECNANFKQQFNVFLVISEAWQRYESKAYGVSNHNLKLQSKKFPQGWADTAFYISNWNGTYIWCNHWLAEPSKYCILH